MGLNVLAFDSNVFMYVLDKHPEFFEPARTALNKAGSEKALISTLVYTESLAKLTGEVFDRSHELLDLLCDQAQIEVIPVYAEVAVLAAQIRSQHSLRTPDALHIATAIYGGASTFMTNDLSLTKLRIDGLKISSL